jgi:hypothetical protein
MEELERLNKTRARRCERAPLLHNLAFLIRWKTTFNFANARDMQRNHKARCKWLWINCYDHTERREHPHTDCYACDPYTSNKMIFTFEKAAMNNSYICTRCHIAYNSVAIRITQRRTLSEWNLKKPRVYDWWQARRRKMLRRSTTPGRNERVASTAFSNVRVCI